MEPGEEAVLIGKQGEEEISVDEVAGLLGQSTMKSSVCSVTVPRVWLHAGVNARENEKR